MNRSDKRNISKSELIKLINAYQRVIAAMERAALGRGLRYVYVNGLMSLEEIKDEKETQQTPDSENR